MFSLRLPTTVSSLLITWSSHFFSHSQPRHASCLPRLCLSHFHTSCLSYSLSLTCLLPVLLPGTATKVDVVHGTSTFMLLKAEGVRVVELLLSFLCQLNPSLPHTRFPQWLSSLLSVSTAPSYFCSKGKGFAMIHPWSILLLVKCTNCERELARDRSRVYGT